MQKLLLFRGSLFILRGRKYLKITIEDKVIEYAKQKAIEGICVENRPTGCSCIGVHIHAEPEYIFELPKYEKNEKFQVYFSEENLKIFIEKSLLPFESVEILGTRNPFNKKMYLHCNVEKK